MNHQTKTMGGAAEDSQRLETKVKDALLRPWLLSLLLGWTLENVMGMPPEEAAKLIQRENERLTTDMKEDGLIHSEIRIQDDKTHLQIDVDLQYPRRFNDLLGQNGFHYAVRVGSKPLEGPINKMYIQPSGKVCEIWAFPDSDDSIRGAVKQYLIARQTYEVGNGWHPAEASLEDAGIGHWFHIYLGSLSESELETNPLDTKQDQLVDVLELIMTDRIDVNRKLELLHSRHQVKITKQIEEDLMNVAEYRAAVKEYIKIVNEMSALKKDSAEIEKKIAARDKEIERLRAELAQAQQASEGER